MGIQTIPVPSSGKTVKGQLFNSNGNWTAPTGVNFVTVSATGGGGGGGGGGSNSNGDSYNGGGSGGDTSFGTNLLVAKGGTGQGSIGQTSGAINTGRPAAAPANSGLGGLVQARGNNNTDGQPQMAAPGYSGGQKIATVAVTPGTSYAIVVGALGAGGNINNVGAGCLGGDGGSGYLSLEWED
jgi:hypothetical protein